MHNIIDLLSKFEDPQYAIFQAKLIPNIDPHLFIGVRVPILRKLAKQYINEENISFFLNELPHKFFDENMFHGILISQITDFSNCIYEIKKFLPFIDNWAVCDTISPVCFKNNKHILINEILNWIKTQETYTSRFGIGMLLKHYLDSNFNVEYLKIISNIKTNEYYLKMMIAWFFATSLAKQWDQTISFITEKRLDKWITNKIIQKACESFRITEEQKSYLKNFKI